MRAEGDRRLDIVLWTGARVRAAATGAVDVQAALALVARAQARRRAGDVAAGVGHARARPRNVGTAREAGTTAIARRRARHAAGRSRVADTLTLPEAVVRACLVERAFPGAGGDSS